MPSSIVHLFVAKRLADFLNIKNLPQFYLGAISPDAVNLEGFADEKTRYEAHIRSKDVNRWLVNIKSYADESREKYADESDFFKGFIVHLLTDIGWDLSVQPRLFSGLEFIGIAPDELKSEKWAELYRFNGMLMGLEEWAEIKGEISKSEPIEITTVSAELLEKFLENLLSEGYSKVDYEPPFVLKFSDVEVTVEKVKKLYWKIF